MKLWEGLETRRSVRRYRDTPVDDDTLRQLIRAAMWAPSAGNARPWHFITVRNRDTLNAVADINPYASMARKAPAGILVCGDRALEKFPGFWVQDCSAAVENLLLAAHEIGLGAVWTGIHPIPERVDACCTLFRLPDNVVPLAFIPLGFSDEKPRKVDRYEEAKIHSEEWL